MKKLLITDLDNTLYDWVSFFAQSFYAMLEKTVEITEIDKATLLEEFRLVHQFHGNTEYPFSILELECIKAHFKTSDKNVLRNELDEALHSFNSKRKDVLKCYAGVVKTLEILNSNGVTIVAHTEAPVRNSLYRLEKLGIKCFFKHLYTPRERYPELWDGETQEWLGANDSFLKLLTKEELKPNPKLLLDICHQEGVLPSEAVYIGDSIVKDIAMANDAGVTSVWAEYGKQHAPEFWDILVSITHWTEEDVRREESLKKALGDSKPDYVIKDFANLLDLFNWHAIK